MELLVDVELLIHIIPKDQTLLGEIEKAFLEPREYPSLGRREDIARIDEVKLVDIYMDELDEDIDLDQDYLAYIPLDLIEGENITLMGDGGQTRSRGTKYKLTKDYRLENHGSKKAPKIFRKWNKVDVLYSSGIVGLENLLVDTDKNIVFAI